MLARGVHNAVCARTWRLVSIAPPLLMKRARTSSRSRGRRARGRLMDRGTHLSRVSSAPTAACALGLFKLMGYICTRPLFYGPGEGAADYRFGLTFELWHCSRLFCAPIYFSFIALEAGKIGSFIVLKWGAGFKSLFYFLYFKLELSI